ncbi:nucleotidyltransferase domain-containing protein [Paenibacillus alkaliterrae]|uniref:type VII toxin-antitoxin system MntA family adenylyltransferase antitoxin n=1 Tax=Paenibacillus alkaliterrae TaxID=320909 RepID=UPI001F3A4E6F|nr:nucleotidyltransferase domain-containing protein [Paenibacillus alkaliterrae]MCF2941010.1 nucleotidyltransferase domain-containing protein [Paenibacillus alkaliterrae]
MVSNGLSDEHKTEIVRFLMDELQAYAIILFGSAAKNSLRQDSDADIAFLSKNSFSSYDLFMAAQRLAELLHREVDLIDFRKASSVFKSQIIGGGVLLYDNEPLERQYAFMQALKEYAYLNDERHEILENKGYPGGLNNGK